MNEWKTMQVPLCNLQEILNNLERDGFSIYSIERKQEHAYIIAKKEVKK